jgi:hypothetical protein
MTTAACDHEGLQRCIGHAQEEFKLDPATKAQCDVWIAQGNIQFCSRHPRCNQLKLEYDDACTKAKNCDDVDPSLPPTLWKMYRDIAYDMTKLAQTCANGRAHFTRYCVHEEAQTPGHVTAVNVATNKANHCERVVDQWDNMIEEKRRQDEAKQLRAERKRKAKEDRRILQSGYNLNSPAFNTRFRRSSRKIRQNEKQEASEEIKKNRMSLRNSSKRMKIQT